MSGKRVLRWGTVRSVTAGAALALLLVAPAEANWLARGSAVLGVGYSLKRNLGEGIDLMGEALDAAVKGDVERVREIGEEIEELPGRLVRDAFPVFKVGAGVRDAVVSAGEKLKSAAGRIPRVRSEALGAMESSRERLRSVPLKVRRYYGDADEGGVDPRMALAVEEEERALFDIDAKVPDEPALAAVAATGDGDAEAGASEASGWDDVAGSEGESQAMEAVAQSSDPWAADEGGTPTSGWDAEPTSSGIRVARVEAIEDDGDDYTGALNALLSDEAAVAGGEASTRGETVTGEGGEATAGAMAGVEEPPEPSGPAEGERFRDCDDCPLMVVVPSGEFMMGSPGSEAGRDDNEGPVHRVTIAEPFAVGVYEVTFDEWEVCLSGGGCYGYRPHHWYGGRGNRPVIDLSWKIAQAYVEWLSRKTGKGYRLLSESEWEYVARAGTETAYHFGDRISRSQARFDSSGNTTVPVGSYPANAFGLHDVHGNAREWVEDCWNESYRGAPNDGSAWKSGNCELRVRRGGSMVNDPEYVRSAARFRSNAGDNYHDGGLRVARTLD